MSLTPEEISRYDEFVTEQPYGIVEPIHAYAAGIAHERARCAKVCRDEAQNWIAVGRQACLICAIEIEAPADGGQPGE